MFYSRAKEYKIEKPATETDRAGFDSKTYKESGSALIHIVQKGANAYRTNELNLTESQYVGYTRQSDIEVGDRIGGMYVVDYVSSARGTYMLSLSSIG